MKFLDDLRLLATRQITINIMDITILLKYLDGFNIILRIIFVHMNSIDIKSYTIKKLENLSTVS